MDDVELELEIDADGAGSMKVPTDMAGELAYNQLALQRYILYCAQNIEGGGLRDKPGKSPDFYHSCYSLSGLSLAQNFAVGSSDYSGGDAGIGGPGSCTYVLGDPSNLLEPTSAVFNIGLVRLEAALKHFYRVGTPCTHRELTI
eukprot:GSChrysophyteH2.ASY1.ANO1.1529.1 assembled CDS